MPQHLTRRHKVIVAGKPVELEFYSLRLLSDVVNRRWEAVKMWEWFKWVTPPIFKLPRMRGRKLSYRWYCADEIELHYDLAIVHGVISKQKKVNLKQFFRELNAEKEALAIQFATGDRLPKVQLDRKFIVRIYETRRRVELMDVIEKERDLARKARALARQNLCQSWQRVLEKQRDAGDERKD